MDELRTEDMQAVVVAALASLGDTASKVAETLRKLNIRGTRRAACVCPIAMFLLKTFPDTVYEDWSVSGGHIIGPGGVHHVPLPVQSFVLRFDAGEWLDLVAPAVTL